MKFWMDKQGYAFRNSVKQWMSGVLEVVYESAALCINTIRTFYLIVLAILGPLVFGLSVFDGFQHTLTQWLARYLNVFLWLPVANIFGSILGKIQENMLKIDISQVHDAGQTFFSSTDVAYLIFLLIGIAGHFCVPSVANYIVNAGGAGGLLSRVNSMTIQTTTTATNTTIAAGSYGAQQIGGLFNTGKFESDPNAGQANNPSDSYQANRFSGKN
jgi:conjugative transposon TraJ protein